jgi:hypothetical protein
MAGSAWCRGAAGICRVRLRRLTPRAPMLPQDAQRHTDKGQGQNQSDAGKAEHNKSDKPIFDFRQRKVRVHV